MQTFSIEHLNTISVPAADVYEALTTERGLAEVWTLDLQVKPAIDHVNEFGFGNERDRIKVVKLEPARYIEWLVIESDPQWIGTIISFELTERNNITAVVLKQSGWKELSDFYRFCNYQWGWFLYSLKHYCEKGTGFPYQRRQL